MKLEQWVVGPAEGEVKMNKKINMKSFLTIVFEVVAVCMCLYHISFAISPKYSPTENQIVHLGFVLVLFYLRMAEKAWDANKKTFMAFNLVCMAVSLSIAVYLFVNFNTLINTVGLYTKVNLVIGGLLMLLLLDSVNRGFGKALAVIYIISILYAKYGSYIPGFFNHNGFAWPRMVATLTTNFTGVFGQVLDVSASFITLFMIFGGLLEASGAGRFFIDLALAIGGRMRSGPAQAAVIGSCLVGSINGSAVANVATTGVFTIPMMKERGYEPQFASAVESVASTGGQLMPPVMGSGAFIMAGILGVSYSKIALAAVIPAFLYYLTAGITVHLHALKLGMKPIPKEEQISLKQVMMEGWYNLVPLVAVFYMLIRGMSVSRAGFWGIVSMIAVFAAAGTIRKTKRFVFTKEFWIFLKEAFVSGAKSTLTVAIACAVMGIVAQVVNMTGLSLKIVYQLRIIAGDIPFLAVVLTMMISIFFGMGVPTTASYVMVAIIAAPVLVEFGFPPIGVHMFVYFYAILANITPPIATAALVASQIGEADYMKTAVQAVKVGIAGFIIPYMFLYHPELLMDGAPLQILMVVATSVLGVLCLAVFFEKWFYTSVSLPERIGFIITGALLIYPEFITSIAGIVIFVILLVGQKMKAKKPALA